MVRTERSPVATWRTRSKRWLTALAATAAVAAACAGCTVHSDAPFLIHDEAGQTTQFEPVLRDYLRELSDEGWHLYLYLFGADAAIEDPASLGVEIESPGSDKVANGTLVLLTAASIPPRFVIRGPGGGELQGRAVAVAAEVTAQLSALENPPENSIGIRFIHAVAEVTGVDILDAAPSSSGQSDRPSWPKAALSVVAVLTLVLVPLRVLLLLWKYRHDTGKITPISSLRPGMKSLVEGELTCDEPLYVPEVDLWAAFTRTTRQYMGKTSRTEQSFEDQGDVWVHTTTHITNETGWKDGHSTTAGAWSQVDDGTGQIWVSGAGAKIDGEFLAASPRRGDKRKTLHAVLTNRQVAVQGVVHEAEDGSLVIGGPKGKLKKGFFVSVLPAKVIARRGRRTAKSAAIQGAILLAACLVGMSFL